MNLLVITQKVNFTDPLLGFFHRWLEVLAKRQSHILVLCLEKGHYDLPENVEVVSLGKERGGSRLRYIFRFYCFIFSERRNYEVVFVHMNQEYIILAGFLWKLLRKKVYLWRNHPKGSFLTRIAVFFSDRVFCTSPESFTARFKKTKVMPVGIDTEIFSPSASMLKKPNSLLFLGRIAPVKKLETIIEALKILHQTNKNFLATIAGGVLPKDKNYAEMIKNKVKKYGLTETVIFEGAVSQNRSVELYRNHQIFLSTTPSGSMDKTQFEAMACEEIITTSNKAVKDFLSPDLVRLVTFKEGSPDDLARVIQVLFALSQDELSRIGKQLRDIVISRHSIDVLLNELSKVIRTE
jgi:glycosyltransferase involved in cell wall biosynthesis